MHEKKKTEKKLPKIVFNIHLHVSIEIKENPKAEIYYRLLTPE